ncbi:MAG: hypothetical protein ACE5D0_09650 [Fidelibacterota bacterium]
MSGDDRIMLVSNYLKQPVPKLRDNYVKEQDLRFTYLPARPLLFIPIGAGERFMLDTDPNFFYRNCTFSKLVN